MATYFKVISKSDESEKKREALMKIITENVFTCIGPKLIWLNTLTPRSETQNKFLEGILVQYKPDIQIDDLREQLEVVAGSDAGILLEEFFETWENNIQISKNQKIKLNDDMGRIEMGGDKLHDWAVQQIYANANRQLRDAVEKKWDDLLLELTSLVRFKILSQSKLGSNNYSPKSPKVNING